MPGELPSRPNLDRETLSKTIGTYVSIVAALAFPVGFLVVSLQLADWYAPMPLRLSLSRGLYLASLLPYSLVVEKAIYVVLWTLLATVVLLIISYIVSRINRVGMRWMIGIVLVFISAILLQSFARLQIDIGRNWMDLILLIGCVIATSIGIASAKYVGDFLYDKEKASLLRNWRTFVPLLLFSLSSIAIAMSVLGVKGPGLPPITIVLKDPNNAQVEETMPDNNPLNPVPPSERQESELQDLPPQRGLVARLSNFAQPCLKTAKERARARETYLLSHSGDGWNIIYAEPDCDKEYGLLTSKKTLLIIPNDEVAEAKLHLSPS